MATGNNMKEQPITNKRLAGNIRSIRQNLKMTPHFTLLGLFSSLSLWLIPAVLGAREPQIELEQILQTTQSWDGINYKSYPTGQPQLTVLRPTERLALLMISHEFFRPPSWTKGCERRSQRLPMERLNDKVALVNENA
jgi:hypothetical protein